MTNKIYFHELTDPQWAELLQSKITWGQLAEQHPQPDWCNYPDALLGEFGCWSLVSRLIKTQTDCQGCDCIREKGDCST